MNYLRLIIDREKRATGYNCAIDTELDELPAAITEAVYRHVKDYWGGLSYNRADFIMRNLLWLLSGYDVKATVTDHTQRETRVYPF
ncbi:hypothetical protein N7605_04785 [Pantoea ananatis]|uniref:hypothetical protein n=1 Tax=Pantoea ananas TaxID=553 RepID=UPI00287C76BF|nr:hypothetical protein [Pantoea ananatis]MDS7719150.1 hypothetical protein [Pantoea ananatis]